MIWEAAYDCPRIMKIKWIFDHRIATYPRGCYQQNAGIITSDHVSPLLRVCREAREVGLANYRAWGNATHNLRVYFNPMIDTLWFPETGFNLKTFQWFCTKLGSGPDMVRYLACPLDLWEDSEERRDLLVSVLDCFPKLKGLTLVSLEMGQINRLEGQKYIDAALVSEDGHPAEWADGMTVEALRRESS
jgi:hypothetical protein